MDGREDTGEQIQLMSRIGRLWAGIKSLFHRMEVHSGAYIFKIVLWLAMAWAIVEFSDDINAKLISATTYFVGILMDMVLLRKQLPETGVEFRRFFVAISILIFFVIVVILIAAIMQRVSGFTVRACMDGFITKALYICGFISTFLELIHNISADD